VLPSMGSVGDAYDNAMCESFFATLECGCWTGAGSRPKPTPRWPASASSKAGTTPYAYIPGWATARRWHTKQPQQQRRWPKHRRNHRILPTLHQSGSTSPAVSALQLTAELAWASWETVMHRTMMMAQGTCSLAEYQSMVDEKTAAALEISGLLFSPNSASAQALLTPWHSRATANAKRLRR